MRAFLIPAVSLVAVAWPVSSAAGRPDASRPGSAGAATRAVVHVNIRGNRFRPHRIVVGVGQRIRWRNRDKEPHTVTTSGLDLSSGTIKPGKRFSYRPRKAGKIPYFCVIHANQSGVIVVR